MLQQPVSQVWLTNVALVKYKSHKLNFELACYPNKVINWRNGVEKDLDEVLQIKGIYSNVKQGVFAKKSDLKKVFGKKSDDQIIEKILREGELQVTELERHSKMDNLLKDIASIIAEKCVDARTGRQVPYTIILRALTDDIHYSVKLNQSAKKQALQIIKQHKDTLGIDRAKMRIKVSFPTSLRDQIEDQVSQVGVENTYQEGNTTNIIGLINPEAYRAIYQGITDKQLAEEVSVGVLDQTVNVPVQEAPKEEVKQPVIKPAPKPGFSCSTCPEANFEDVTEHRNHFKSLWHKYNIKRKVRELALISYEEFSIMDQEEIENFVSSKNL